MFEIRRSETIQIHNVNDRDHMVDYDRDQQIIIETDNYITKLYTHGNFYNAYIQHKKILASSYGCSSYGYRQALKIAVSDIRTALFRKI